MVTRIDRLARSIGDLQDIVKILKAKGVILKATKQPIDTSTATGKAFLDMLGVFAEFETNLRRERQLALLHELAGLTEEAGARERDLQARLNDAERGPGGDARSAMVAAPCRLISGTTGEGGGLASKPPSRYQAAISHEIENLDGYTYSAAQRARIASASAGLSRIRRTVCQESLVSAAMTLRPTPWASIARTVASCSRSKDGFRPR